MTEIKDSIKINNFVSGFGAKSRGSVRVVSTSNINLAVSLAGITIDGVILIAGDRVLLIAQSTGTQNGIYDVNAGLATRSNDFEEGDNISQVNLSVNEGTIYANTVWQVCSFGSNSIIGTGTLNFKQKNVLNYAAGDFIYPNSSNTLSILGKPASTAFLQMTNSGVPSWNTVLGNSKGYFTSNTDGGISANNFHRLNSNGQNRTETRTAVLAIDNITLTKIGVRLTVSPGTGNSRTFTVRVNQANTALTVTISDSNLYGEFSTNVAVSAGQLISCQNINNGGAGSEASLAIAYV